MFNYYNHNCYKMISHECVVIDIIYNKLDFVSSLAAAFGTS